MEFCETFEKRIVDGSFTKDVPDKSLSDIVPPSLQNEVSIIKTVVSCKFTTPKAEIKRPLGSQDSHFLKALNSFPHGRALEPLTCLT